MSSQDNEVEYRVVAVLLVAVIVLVTGFAVGLGIHKSRGGAPTTQAAAPAAAPAMAAASSDDASVVVENGVVKFYFASGKADLAAGALVALGDAIAAAHAEIAQRRAEEDRRQVAVEERLQVECGISFADQLDFLGHVVGQPAVEAGERFARAEVFPAAALRLGDGLRGEIEHAGEQPAHAQAAGRRNRTDPNLAVDRGAASGVLVGEAKCL